MRILQAVLDLHGKHIIACIALAAKNIRCGYYNWMSYLTSNVALETFILCTSISDYMSTVGAMVWISIVP